jgi:hypothetical protein
MGKISLSKDKVNLEKHVVNLSKTVINLSKKAEVDLSALTSKVVVVLDHSGSIMDLYEDGTVQETLTRLVPLGLTFDDNGEIDVYLFQNDYKNFEGMNVNNYENYVRDVINRSGYSYGGTEYAPVLNAIINGGKHQAVVKDKKRGLFGLKFTTSRVETVKDDPIVDDVCPTFILFITDGDNAREDRSKTDELLRQASDKNVFIQFIGIGDRKFEYLRKLDDLDGRVRDNTGFTQMSSLRSASDDELYTEVLEEFSHWLKGMQ